MRYKRSYFFVLPFLALGFLVMGRSAEGDVVEEVSTKQEGAVANISRDNMKLEDIDVEVKREVENMEVEEVVVEQEVEEVEQKMLASESLGDLRLELGRTLLLQGGLEVELGHILVRVKTLPKAQRTRGLSSSCKSNFLRSYHKFKNKS